MRHQYRLRHGIGVIQRTDDVLYTAAEQRQHIGPARQIGLDDQRCRRRRRGVNQLEKQCGLIKAGFRLPNLKHDVASPALRDRENLLSTPAVTDELNARQEHQTPCERLTDRRSITCDA
ncbi:hypothetical protein Cmtc_52630 [Cupriavidus sp. TKC]|nr:hypothetical protein Cmtc_52630 [Cupriavidus sp. TKC]